MNPPEGIGPKEPAAAIKVEFFLPRESVTRLGRIILSIIFLLSPAFATIAAENPYPLDTYPIFMPVNDSPTPNRAGDIDHSGAIELSDAILALQSLLGPGPLPIFPDSDVNKDGAVGTPEVIYILQVLSGIRDWDPKLPTVMGTNPAHEAVEVFPDTSVRAQFNEPLEPSSVTIDTCLIQMQGGPMISGVVTLDLDVVTFTPSTPFSFDSEYTVILKAGIQNRDGSTMPSDYSFTFRTLAEPAVLTTDPAPNAENVPTNAVVSITFNNEIKEETENDISFSVTTDGDPIGGDIHVSGKTVTFTPSASLSHATLYTVILKAGIQDLNEIPLPDVFVFSFKTEAPQQVSVSVLSADQYGVKLRLDPPLPGLLPADLGLSLDGETFVSPEALNTTDNGANYTVAMPLDACGTYTLRLNKLGYAFGSDMQISPLSVVNATVSEIGVSGFTLTLGPPIPQLAAQEVRLEAQGTSEIHKAGAVETDDDGKTYRVYLALAHGESYELDIRNDCYQIDAPTMVQVPEPTVTWTIANLSYDRNAGNYAFDIRSDIQTNKMHYTLQPEAVIVLDEDGIPVTVSEPGVILWNNNKNIAFRVTADLRHGMTHLVDLYAPQAPYSFAGAEITTKQVVTFEVADAWIGSFTIVTDIPLHGLAPENIAVETGHYPNTIPIEVASVTTSSDGLTHTVYAPVDLHTGYTVRLVIPEHSFYPSATGSDAFSLGLRYITIAVSDPTLAGFTLLLDIPVEGLTIDELKLTNSDGPHPTVESLTTDDNGASYHVRTQLETLNRYTVGFERYGYHFYGANIHFYPEPPTAVDDAPAPFSGYTTVHDTDLTVLFESGLLSNDNLGVPKASLISFGGGSLGGTYGTHEAGASASLAGGILQIQGDGSFSLSGQPFIPGTYSFAYLIRNDSDYSVASVTLHIQERPAVVSTAPAQGGQNVGLEEKIRIQLNNPIDPATVDTSSFEVTRGGEPVQGEIVASENIIVFTPADPFILDTVYEVVLTTAIEDMNHNAMAEEYRFTFRTAGPPEVLSTDPTTGELNVAVDKIITITFNNTLDASTVIESNFIVTGEGESVAGNLDVDVAGNTILFTPFSTLAFDTRYTVILTADIRDENGIPMEGPYLFNFRTVALPKVLSTDPVPGAENILTDAVVSISFNNGIKEEAENDISFSVTQAGAPVAGDIVVDGNTITFIPYAQLSFNTEYTVTLGAGIQDIFGNTLPGDYVFTFRTVALPQVLTTDPVPGAENILTDTVISISFNNGIKEETQNNISFSVTKDGEPVAGSIDVYGDTVTFKPSAHLYFDTEYTVTLRAGIQDIFENTLPSDYVFTFQTVALPEVLATNPLHGAENAPIVAVVSITFNNEIKEETDNDISLLVTKDGDSIAGRIDVDDNIVTFTPFATFSYSAEYTVTLRAGIKDVHGTDLPEDYTFTFDTVVLPEIVTTEPSPGGENVLVDGIRSITFNKFIDPETVDASTFVVTGDDGPVDGKIDVNDKTISFTPYAPYSVDSFYTVVLTTGIKDISGYSIAGDYSFPFKTASLKHITVSVVDADQHGLEIRLEPPVPGLQPGHIGVSVDGETFLSPEAVSTSDNGETYTVTMPLNFGGMYHLRLEKPGYDFGSDVGLEPILTVYATVSKIGVSGFTLTLDPALTDLAPEEVLLEALGTSDAQPVSALETTNGGATYRVYFPLIMGETYALDISRDGPRITLPQVLQLPEPTLTGTIEDLTLKWDIDSFTGRYEFDLRINKNPPNWTYNLQPHDITILDEDGMPVQISECVIDPNWNENYQAFAVTADLKHGMTHLVDVYAAHVPYIFAGVEIKLATFDVENAVFGEFTILTDVPVTEVSSDNIVLEELYSPYTPVEVQSVSTSIDGLTHVVKAPLDVGVDYKVSLVLPGFHVDPGIITFRTYERLITFTVSDATPNGITLGLNSPVDGLTSAELTLTNLDGPDPAVESLTTDDSGLTYRFSTQLTPGNRYEITLVKYGYQSIPKYFSIDAQLPTAVDDAPGPAVGYSTLHDTDLLVTAGSGLLSNDYLGAPEASLTSFGGGSLGGDALDHAAGVSVALAGGTLQIDSDGSFRLSGQLFIPGTYSFNYRITNASGTSDATVTLQVQQVPAVVSAFPAPDTQGVSLREVIRIAFNNEIKSATVGEASLQVFQGGVPIDGSINVSTNEIIFTPSTDFALDTVYTVVLKNDVEDINGNSMGSDYSFTFRSAALPAVQSIFPASGAENVAVDEAIRISFNNPIDEDTVDKSSLEVIGDGGPVEGNVDVDDNTIMFTPSVPFELVTTYTVTLKAGVQDENGNSLPGDDTFTFTTAALQHVSPAVLDATTAGVEIRLDPPVSNLLPANVGLSTDGVIFDSPQTVDSTDNGATYTITTPLDAGGLYLLRLDKPGYEFDAYMQIEPGAIVTATVSDVGVSGFTLALDPPLPYLEAGEVWLETQGTLDTQPVRALETTDGGATYRAYIPLTLDEAYTLDIRNDRYQLDSGTTIQMSPPTFTGTITQVFPDHGLFRIRLNTDAIQQGDHRWSSIKPEDVTVLDDDGLPVTVTHVSRYEGGYSGDTYVVLSIGAELKDGMTYLVDVRVPGETFEGVGVALTQKVIFDVDPDDSAVVGEFTIHTDMPLHGLLPEQILLEETYYPYTPVPVQTVWSSDDGRTHVVHAPVELDTWYSVELKNFAGYRFEAARCCFTPYPRFIQLTLEDETPFGFTLMLNPAVEGLTSDQLRLTNLDGPHPVVESFTTDDGGHTYQVTTVFRNLNRYQVTLEEYGYTFPIRNVSYPVIRVDHTNTREDRHDGFTLVFSHPADGLTTEHLTLTSEVSGEQLPIASINSGDGGITYLIEANLIPGHVYRIDIEKPGYLIGGQRVLPPEADLSVSEITEDGFTLSLSPPVPGLGPGDLILSTNIGGSSVTPPITAVTTTDGGTTYAVEVNLQEDSWSHLDIPVIGGSIASSSGSTHFYTPRWISWSVPEIFPDRLTLEFSYPVKHLKPDEVVLVDTQGVEWHPEFVAANDDDGSAFTVWFDVPVGQTYSVEVRAVRTGPYDWGQKDPFWQFVGPAPDILVPNWVLVDVSVDQVTADEVTLALRLAVSDLLAENIELVSVVDGNRLPISIDTPDGGFSYSLFGDYLPGNDYAIRIEKPGYRFGMPKAFSIGSPPTFTGAWTNAEGTTVVLRFNKDMAEPPVAPAGFTLTEDGNPQTIVYVARNPEDTRQLRLHLGQALGTGELSLSHVPAGVAATDAGPLEAFESTYVANQRTVLGTAFVLAIQYATVSEISTTLVTRFALDEDGLLAALKSIGYGASELAEALSTAFLLNANQFAARLDGEGFDSRTITNALLDIERDDPAIIASALFAIGKDASTAAAELHWAFHIDPETSAALLRDAGYELLAITHAVRSMFAQTAGDSAVVLINVGFDAVAVATVLETAYQLSLSGVASALREAGVDATQVAAILLTFAAQENTPAALGKTLSDGGIEASEIALALESVYGTTVDVLSALLEAGLSLEAAGLRLRDVWILEITSAYDLLAQAGLSHGSSIEVLGTVYGLNAMANLAYGKGWPAQDIASDMLEHLRASPEGTVAALFQAGYPIGDAASAFREIQRIGGDEAGPLLSAEYGAADAECVAALRDVGYDATAAVNALVALHGYNVQVSLRIAALRDGGFPMDEMMLGIVNNAEIINRLRGAHGYPLAQHISSGMRDAGIDNTLEAVNGLQAAGIKFDTNMISALCWAGYPLLPVLETWIAQTGATPGAVVRLRHQQSLISDCGLPYGPHADAAAIFVSHLRALFPSADTAAERVMSLAALREGGYLAEDAAKAIQDTLGDPGADVMLHDLLQAGYSPGDALDELRYQYHLYDLGHLIRMGLDAGLSPSAAAEYLDGYTLPSIVGIFAKAGLPAQNVALVLRQYYEATAGEALDHLEQARCPYHPCYSFDDVVSAVETVFNTDPLLLTVQQMAADGKNPWLAANHLRDRFGLDMSETATALRDGGFSQSDVIYGVYKAFPEEWARLSSSVPWNRPETYEALHQVLENIYGVTSTLDQLNGVLDVAKRDGTGNSILNALHILDSGPYDLEKIVLFLQDRMPYDDQVFTDNRQQVLDYLFENAGPRSGFGYGYDAIRVAVADVYGTLDSRAEAAAWANFKKLYGTPAARVAILVRERFQAGGDDPVETAFMLNDAGWAQDTVLLAVAEAYHRNNRTALYAGLLQAVYQKLHMTDLAAALLNLGQYAQDIYNVLIVQFPTASRGSIITSLLSNGVPRSTLEGLVSRWIVSGQKDDSVAAILPAIYTNPNRANIPLWTMGYTLEERLGWLTSSFGFAPEVVMGALSDDVSDMATYFSAQNIPARQVAEGIRRYYGGSNDLSGFTVADILWQAGYPRRDIVFALAPAKYAFYDGLTPDGMFPGVSPGDLFRALKPLIEGGAFSAEDVVRDLNDIRGAISDVTARYADVYVADTSNHRIKKFNSFGHFLTQWGHGGAGNGEFGFPEGVAIDGQGKVYVANAYNHRIQKFDSEGNFLTTWGTEGSGDGEFNDPQGVAVDASGNVFVADTGNHRIQVFDNQGKFFTKWGALGTGDRLFNSPSAVAADASGNVYVTDTGNQRIQVFDKYGNFVSTWGPLFHLHLGALDSPHGVAVDMQNNVNLIDTYNYRIMQLNGSGDFLRTWGTAGNGDYQFMVPKGVAVGPSGSDLDLFELLRGVYDAFGAREAYRTANALQDLPQWGAVAASIFGSILNPDQHPQFAWELVGLRVLKHFGADVSVAARLTIGLTQSDPSDWFALVKESTGYLQTAGYGWHESYWAAYDAHGLNDPVWGDVLTMSRLLRDDMFVTVLHNYVAGF